MTVTDMETRLEFLKSELEREVHLLVHQVHPEAPVNGAAKSSRKASVGKILLEVGALQMRLMDAGRRR